MPMKLTRKKSDISKRIVPVSQLGHHTSMLIYGGPGTGKTAFASTFPKPSLILDIKEKGTETVSQVKGMDAFQAESWEDFEEIYWYLEKGNHKFESVIIDQVTQLQSLGMTRIREKKGMEPDEPFSQRSWGQLGGLMQQWLYNYRELSGKGMNVCFIAHERVFNSGDDEEGDDRIAPTVGARLTPSVVSFLNGAVSVIGNTFILEDVKIVKEKLKKRKERTVQYCMRVGPHAQYHSKIRRPPDAEEALPDYIVNPTYDKVMKLSRGESFKPIKRIK